MTEVLAHTISMLRGRNGSNSSRNLKWDALDTLLPVCPPAECYTHAYVQPTHTLCSPYMQTTCTLCFIRADCRLQISLPDTYCSLVVVQMHANCCQQFSMQSKELKKGMLEANNFANNVQCSQQFSMQSKSGKQLQQGWSGMLEKEVSACKQSC